jgi:hypothetical protein
MGGGLKVSIRRNCELWHTAFGVVVKTCHGLEECSSGMHQVQMTGARHIGVHVLDRAADTTAGLVVPVEER